MVHLSPFQCNAILSNLFSPQRNHTSRPGWLSRLSESLAPSWRYLAMFRESQGPMLPGKTALNHYYPSCCFISSPLEDSIHVLSPAYSQVTAFSSLEHCRHRPLPRFSASQVSKRLHSHTNFKPWQLNHPGWPQTHCRNHPCNQHVIVRFPKEEIERYIVGKVWLKPWQVSRCCSPFRHPGSPLLNSSQQLPAYQLHAKVSHSNQLQTGLKNLIQNF